MRKHLSFILLLLTTCLWVVCFGLGNQPHSAQFSNHTAESSATQQVGFSISQADCTLPVSIDKTQLPILTHISARQLIKRISESVFGHTAKCYTTCSVVRLVVRTHNITINLETCDISFPFSAFW